MIAISYRREDSQAVAGRLYDRLEQRFGKNNVFMDFDSIRPGFDFRDQIMATVERSKVMIALVGPNWTGTKSDGSRRIDEPTDFVRLEIACALARNIPVVPVLIDHTPMPKPEILSGDIQGFAFRHALPLDSGLDFRQHADRLIASICEIANWPCEKENASADGVSVSLRRKSVFSRRPLQIGLVIALMLGVAGIGTWISRVRIQMSSKKHNVTASIPAYLQGEFYFKSKATDFFLDLRYRTTGNREAVLVQAPFTGRDTQVWSAVPTADYGFFYLVSKDSMKRHANECLEIKRAQPDDYLGLGGQRVDVDGQEWAISEAEPGFFVVTSKLNGKAIDIPWGRKDDGLIIGLFSPHRGNNQLWQLVPIKNR
jgi:TIR domain